LLYLEKEIKILTINEVIGLFKDKFTL